ncbi:MAG: hypothetical protein CVU11_05905 [Bacteroidetes bacterium HGW-Bacteroidetes-6]|jgi:hypothetical protein|nr:MAG: hypothetical protein CVU11_05905 [Bacteroidetes bacterium HGW-Bacteroidetes-6]
MKKTLFFLAFCFGFMVFTMAQIPVKESDVPETVKTKLGNLFPGFSGVQWTKHNTNYHAAFAYDDAKVLVKLSEIGKWITSESEYQLENLPRSLQKHLSSNFGTYKVNRAIMVESKDISEYRIEMIDTVTSNTMTAYYDITGNFVRQADANGNDQNISLNNGGTEKGRHPVHPKELPSSVNSYIIVNYPNHIIKESYIVNNETYQNAYLVYLNKADESSNVELWFDFQGTLIKIGGPENNTSNNGKEGRDDKNNKKNVRQPISENKVPATAVQYFTKKEPKADEIRWDTIGKEYVVSYHNSARNIDCRMHFDNKGAFVKQVTILSPKDLHPLIQSYLDENYYDLEVESAEALVMADKKKYTVVKLFSPDWANDPMVYHEIYFSTSGRLEKEVLANYIDGDEAFRKQQQDERNNQFNEYVDNDDLSIDENAMVDGQMIMYKELPSKTISYLSTNYPDYRFVEGIIISDENMLEYSVIIKREGYNERKRVLFDMKGNFLKAEDF